MDNYPRSPWESSNPADAFSAEIAHVAAVVDGDVAAIVCSRMGGRRVEGKGKFYNLRKQYADGPFSVRKERKQAAGLFKFRGSTSLKEKSLKMNSS